MAVEFKVRLQDEPGTLARRGHTLGDAGVNIEAIQGTTREGHGFVHFVPRNPQQAARALDAAGIGYTKREALIIRVLDKPGMLTISPLLRADQVDPDTSGWSRHRRHGEVDASPGITTQRSDQSWS